VYNVKTSYMLLPMHNDAYPSHVPSTCDHDNIPCVEFDEVCDFPVLKVKLYCIVGTDERVWIANGSTIVSDDMWHAPGTKSNFANFAEFVGCFFMCDAVNGKAAFDIVKEPEIFIRFFD
jgi:hypothetical protein